MFSKDHLNTQKMGRRAVNLKHVNSLKGTGTANNEESSYSPAPFVNYLYTMVKILLLLFLFCFITTNNYFNAMNFDENVDYPVGKTLNDLINSNQNPYCFSYMDCKQVSLQDSENVSKLSWWFQTTQESCYRIAGLILHYYLKFLRDWCIFRTSIPYTGYVSFARWVIFGIITLISIMLLMCFIWIIFIPGWIGGLFAFMKLQTNNINKFALFCFSVFLTICLGWVSVFPVIYEFFQLLYMFFFKQLIRNSDNYGPEFSKRMSNMVIVFVVVAVIVAMVQLPPISAAIIASIVFLAMIFMKNKSLYKSKSA